MDRFATMETFIRVVESRSFSAAARHLNLGQPAVSKSIAQLEERLGARLLLRSTRGLMPTEAGQNFYERARRAVEEAKGAERAARCAGSGLAGRLRVSAAATPASLHIVPRLPMFLAAHPDVSIDLVLADRAIDLIEEGVDVALRTGTLRDSALTARKIATGRRLVFGTPAYFERAGIPRAPAELSAHAMVVYTQDDSGGRSVIQQRSSQMPVTGAGRLRMSAAEGVRAAVLAGMGVAIMPEWLFAPELASGVVRTVLADWTLPPIDLWAVFPTGRMMSAKARAFTDYVEAGFHKAQCEQRPGLAELQDQPG